MSFATQGCLLVTSAGSYHFSSTDTNNFRLHF